MVIYDDSSIILILHYDFKVIKLLMLVKKRITLMVAENLENSFSFRPKNTKASMYPKGTKSRMSGSSVKNVTLKVYRNLNDKQAFREE